MKSVTLKTPDALDAKLRIFPPARAMEVRTIVDAGPLDFEPCRGLRNRALKLVLPK
jgi:hypothetical protein